MSSGEVPEGRCGFVVEPMDVHEEIAVSNEAQSHEWYKISDAVCCWREVWEGGDGEWCIWHAKTETKSAEALIRARVDEAERLDGAYVPSIELGDSIDFEDCRLSAATFDGTDLAGNSFENVDGEYTKFLDVHLKDARFSDVNFHRAQFRNVNLHGSQFSNSNVWGAQFHETHLRSARFTDTNLAGAQFPNADLGVTKFSDAILVGAEFSNASLGGAQFSETPLRQAQFHNATLRWAELPHADLTESQFADANLTGANLSNVDATDATFTGATLEDATLRAADLGNADLTDTLLFDAHFLDVRINEGTEFRDVTPDEVRATRLTPAGIRPYVHHAAGTTAAFTRQIDYEPCRTPSTDPPPEGLPSRLATLPGLRHLHDRLQPSYEAARRWWFWYRTDRDTLDLPYEDLGKANTVYRTIQRLYRENSMPRRIDTYHVRARDTRRKQAIIDGDLGRWLYLAGQRWVMGYGERPWRVVGTSVVVMLTSTLGYLVAGPFARTPAPEDATIVGGHLLAAVPFTLPGWLAEVLTSLYFSVVTFTTLGYGDLQPASGVAQTIATVESFVGALLMALLVFVLGRRTGR